MKPTWRWFGPEDPISLEDITQTGAEGIVTALHYIHTGQVWPQAAIRARNDMIKSAGLSWDVVESLPVSEAIKRGTPEREAHFEAYRQSLAHLATEGVTTVCYNFMPILDWTRTDLSTPLPGGGTALRFTMGKLAAFDIHLLKRKGARDAYPAPVLADAQTWFETADPACKELLSKSVAAGLPGAVDGYDLAALRDAIDAYATISPAELRANLRTFLEAVVPTAEKLGITLAIHPDDPPRPILGVPRIVSTEADLAAVLDAVPSPANKLTFCAGSLASRTENNLIAMLRRFGDAIGFVHLRNVWADADGSFTEAHHLGGDIEMPAVIDELLEIEAKNDINLPYRPDHGADFTFDQTAGAQPGYALLGRMRGLAELRGVIAALS